MIVKPIMVTRPRIEKMSAGSVATSALTDGDDASVQSGPTGADMAGWTGWETEWYRLRD